MNSLYGLKTVILGETRVGKTSIISQFISHSFDFNCECSIATQYASKVIKFEDIKQAR